MTVKPTEVAHADGSADRLGAAPVNPDADPVERRPRPKRRLRTVISWLCGVLLAAIIGVLLASVVVPLAMGWVPLTVLTGSMEPTIPPGSQVVVKPLRPEQTQGLTKGQIITYLRKPGTDDMITHRIIDVAEVDGETVYRTQGDANNAPDPDPVRSVQVRGVVRYHVPLVGYVAQLTTPDQKRTGIWIVAGLLIAYAVWEVCRPKRKGSGRH
ncbi:signal peptidase I [Brevibacterium celere]|uniref:signal peptidase I n=1 Tax=Brevibacterium celere TaxID=225845 RepID=UPI0031D37D37